jgi:hypothetical protein
MFPIQAISKGNQRFTQFDMNHDRNRLPVIFKHRTEGHITFKNTAKPYNIYKSMEHSYIGNFQGL